MGGRGPGGGRAEATGGQDRGAVGGAVAGGKKGAGRHPPASGQPLGDCGKPGGRALGQPERPVGGGAQAGRARRRAYPRPASQPCLEGAGPGGEPDYDREVARTPAGAHHGPLCPPCAGFGEGIGRESGGEHRPRHREALHRSCCPMNCQCSIWRAIRRYLRREPLCRTFMLGPEALRILSSRPDPRFPAIGSFTPQRSGEGARAGIDRPPACLATPVRLTAAACTTMKAPTTGAAHEMRSPQHVRADFSKRLWSRREKRRNLRKATEVTAT